VHKAQRVSSIAQRKEGQAVSWRYLPFEKGASSR
jgi:hypothetical protein